MVVLVAVFSLVMSVGTAMADTEVNIDYQTKTPHISVNMSNGVSEGAVIAETWSSGWGSGVVDGSITAKAKGKSVVRLNQKVNAGPYNFGEEYVFGVHVDGPSWDNPGGFMFHTDEGRSLNLSQSIKTSGLWGRMKYDQSDGAKRGEYETAVAGMEGSDPTIVSIKNDSWHKYGEMNLRGFGSKNEVKAHTFHESPWAHPSQLGDTEVDVSNAFNNTNVTVNRNVTPFKGTESVSVETWE